MKHVALSEACIKIIKAADKFIPLTPPIIFPEFIFPVLSLDYPLKPSVRDSKRDAMALFSCADEISASVIEQCRAVKWMRSIHHSYFFPFTTTSPFTPSLISYYPTSHTLVLTLPSTVFLPTHLLPWLQ